MGKQTETFISGLIFAGILVAGVVWAAIPPSKSQEFITLTPSSIERVYDGDTFYINLPDLPDVFGKRLGVRIVGIDTPEMRSKCKTRVQKANEKKLALDAKDSLTSKLQNAKVIELTDLQRDKYFRLLAEVKVDGNNVSEALIAEGYAVAYDGGTKAGWCF